MTSSSLTPVATKTTTARATGVEDEVGSRLESRTSAEVLEELADLRREIESLELGELSWAGGVRDALPWHVQKSQDGLRRVRELLGAARTRARLLELLSRLLAAAEEGQTEFPWARPTGDPARPG